MRRWREAVPRGDGVRRWRGRSEGSSHAMAEQYQEAGELDEAGEVLDAVREPILRRQDIPLAVRAVGSDETGLRSDDVRGRGDA